MGTTRFRVEERAPGEFVIVSSGTTRPLPAVYDSREKAQEIADRLNAHQDQTEDQHATGA